MTGWGILATGKIAAKFVADLRLLPGAAVVAVGSRSPESARAFADRYEIPRAHGSWSDLAADDAVDVVYVATPHSAHHAAATACLRAGRAVLCEKPLTLDRTTSAELIETARTHGVFLMEAMWMRCIPAVRRMMDVVAAGAIGDVVSVQAAFGIAGPFPPEHRLRSRALGGGALLDLGVYPITLAHLLLGAPDEVRSWAKRSPEGVDENTGIIFGYASGAVATLMCGMVGATPRTATITGTAGHLHVPHPFHHPEQFTIHRNGADAEVVTAKLSGWGYHYEAAEVQRCLREGLLESPLVPHAATLEVMGLLDTVREQIGVRYA